MLRWAFRSRSVGFFNRVFRDRAIRLDELVHDWLHLRLRLIAAHLLHERSRFVVLRIGCHRDHLGRLVLRV